MSAVVADPAMPRLEPGMAESPPSAVSGTAILAGALVAVSASLVLVLLGTGFGLAAISPWPHMGASAATFATSTAIGLIIIQWISASLGGYITGRLRTRWTSLHTHEVFFRDTAHGLVMWSLATLVVSAVTIGAAMSSAGAATHAAGTVAGVASAPSVAQVGTDYDIDVLLRPTGAQSQTPTQADSRGQIARIVAQAIATGSIPDADRAYLAGVISAQTGATPAEAQSRVDALVAKTEQVKSQAREAADAARRTAEKTALFTGLRCL